MIWLGIILVAVVLVSSVDGIKNKREFYFLFLLISIASSGYFVSEMMGGTP